MASVDSNVSKGDLEAIRVGLGLHTDGVKADLLQRLKTFSAGREHERSLFLEENVDIDNKQNEIASLISNQQETVDVDDSQRKSQKRKVEEYNEETGQEKVILEFKWLEKAILGFKEELNSVAAQ
ncbi:10623_t:CDS:2, partial [Acaulospora colombiana]